MTLEPRNLLIVLVIAGIIFAMFFKLKDMEKFKETRYGNYPSQHKPCSYNSWDNTFYSENDRYNTCFNVLPGKNKNKNNVPLPYNIHSGQTIKVANPDLISVVGCPIDKMGAQIPEKLYKKSENPIQMNVEQKMEADLESQSVIHELPVNEEIEKFEEINFVESVPTMEESKDIEEPPVEDEKVIIQPIEETNEEDNQFFNSEHYNMYIMIFLLILFFATLFC